MRIHFGLGSFGLIGFSGIVCSILFSSCFNTRHYTYMQGQFDTTKLSTINLPEPVIRKGDLLSIIVYSDNPAATALFNQPILGGAGNGGGALSTGSSSGTSGGVSGGGGSVSGASSGGSPATGGYLVDEKGNIQFQGLGMLHVDSMTKSALRDTLNSRLKDFLSNPYCTIRFLNYRVTLLGEVTRPGIFNIPGEHINLLEALGLGGDLTFYGRRDNILVIREVNGKREYGRMDITKPEIMGSPFFDLKPNDVVYVEATRKKIAANDQTVVRNVTIATSLISVVAILVSLFRR
jgi:polysaccharide export outer membrane protein